jgi:enterochelin esterase-like enzyme
MTSRTPNDGTLGRRALLSSLGSAALVGAGCSRTERASGGAEPTAPSSAAAATLPRAARPPAAGESEAPASSAPASAARGTTRLLTLDFAGAVTPVAVVVVPAWGKPADRYPVLVALHGRGEALKPPPVGAMGWARDYALTRAFERLAAPPLIAADLEGFVEPDHLAALNHGLAEHPFGGLVVACPYLPDIDLRSDAALRAYGRFVVDQLLPKVRSEAPALEGRDHTGIDGVSLGGFTALRVGLTNPDAFVAVGALQPAISDDQAGDWTEFARAARRRAPDLQLRLLTSHEDDYHGTITRLSAQWRAAGIGHEFLDLPGPHDYPFNRGPGSIEMLLWHDRILRGVRAP